MRKHLVVVVVVILITVSLFTAWFVRFLDTILIQQSSSQVLSMTGKVESAQVLGEWNEMSLDQSILPNTYLRTFDNSTLTIWLDPVSRLVLQPNTQVQYIGFQNGSPTWQVITGTINGRYDHPADSDRVLTLKLNQSVLSVVHATFQVKNELTDTSVTAYDQPLTINLGTAPDSDLKQTITVLPGETYAFTGSDSVEPIAEITPEPTTESSALVVAQGNSNNASVSATTTQSTEVVLPDSLQDFVTPQLTNSISLTIGATKPLTFIWTEASQTATKQSYRIFRSETEPLDEKTAAGYRTTTGTQHISFAWPLPSTNTTYYLRVCRLKNNLCEVWSNTITIPAGTFDQ